MDAFLRVFDRNLAQRRLRFLLTQMAEDLGRDAASVPHSFDRAGLVSHAQGLLGARGIRRQGRQLDLLERLGIVYALSGDRARGLEMFQRGRKLSPRAGEDARFLYLIASQIHYRTGEFQEARRAFEEVAERRRILRDLRTRAHLFLARTARQQQDAITAERACGYVRRSGVLKYRPLADYYLGILRMQQGRFDEAIEMNRRAYASFRRDRQALALRLGDGDLALIYMAQGDYRKARAILERVAREDVKILDTNAAGLTFNNLAVSCAKLRDLRGARDAYLRALGFHAAGNRRHLLAGTYANLGMTLSKLGEIEPAFAALDRAIELAEEIKSAEIGLRARTAAIEAVLRHGTRLGLIPVLTTRCDEIVRKSASEVSKDALQEYSTALAEIVSAQVQKGLRERRAAKTETVGSRSGQSALEKLADRIDGSRYREMLADRLGEGLRRRFAPPPGELCDFLMLFTGDYLRFHDYVSEFWLTVSRGKLHLRELCDRRILDIDGNRKAAKYSLAFHRPS